MVATKNTSHGFVYPLRVQKEKKEHHIILLITQLDDKSHYSLIVNFSRLFSNQVSSYGRKMFFCYSYLTGFSASNLEETRETCERLRKHSEICKTLYQRGYIDNNETICECKQ